ncbi:hypothetical protein C8A01DRAFT_40014 [Parachaetomium inaequale]|uniref:Uncharacterized protein n=1 Tax=Parachaetomium inaequale TaxID=2588326 RepID=A0AAN6P8B1_9PEZI|nr:hypothetical protein C8A01DRAFT_40014 [Parachaetomium inaequale]
MQLLTVKRLQSDLVREALQHRYLSEGEPDPTWLGPEADYSSSTMRQYVLALQDYDYMVQRAARRGDPFLVSSASTAGFALLKEHLESIIKSQPAQNDISSTAGGNKGDPVFSARSDLDYLLWLGNPKLDVLSELKAFRRAMTANVSNLKAYLYRLSAALAVSMFLIAPMVTIIFIPGLGQQRASGVAAGFIFIFAVAAAVVFKDNFGVVSATAAYAAVLVVFVSAGQAVVV